MGKGRNREIDKVLLKGDRMHMMLKLYSVNKALENYVDRQALEMQAYV